MATDSEPRPIVDSGGTLAPLARLVAPALAEQLLVMLVGFSDTWLTGWFLDQPHLAAINQINYILWFLNNLFYLVSIGATAMVARFVGAGDYPAARRVSHQALILGALLTLVPLVIGLMLTPQLIAAAQLEGEAAAAARQFLSYIWPVLPLIMVVQVGTACLRGAGDMVTGLVAMTVVNVVNVSIGWLFVDGWGVLPQLGWQALAIGTASGYVVGALLIGAVLLAGRSGLRIEPRLLLRPDRDLQRRLLRIGVPGGIDVISLTLCHLAFVGIVNRLGDLPAAAHGLAIRVESLAYLPGFAFQLATMTLTGQYLGAGRPDRASHAVKMSCLFGVGLLTLVSVLFFTQSEALVALFVRQQNEAVAPLAAHLLRIVALSTPFAGAMVIFNGALRGAGDTRWPLLFTFIGMVLVRLPVAWWLTTHGWGVVGAWYAMALDIWIRTALVSVRFASGGWKKVEV